MINVVNRKYHEPTDRDFYVGRGSPLGNPKRISHVTSREEAIGYYVDYLTAEIANGNKVIRGELNRIWKAARTGDVNLVCFCKPQDCHGDFIKKLIEEKL